MLLKTSISLCYAMPVGKKNLTARHSYCVFHCDGSSEVRPPIMQYIKSLHQYMSASMSSLDSTACVMSGAIIHIQRH